MTWLWMTLLISISVFGVNTANAAYTFEDLQALEQQKAHREFLDHARDIRPSERSKVWSEMLGNMATGLMVDLLQKKDFSLKTFLYTQTVSDWPELREDAFFHTKREAYVLGYLEHCYSKNLPTCKLNAQEAWHIGRKNLDNGTLIAEIVAKYDTAHDLSNYIQLAIKADVSRFYCRKDFIQNWIISKVSTKIFNSEDPAAAKSTFLSVAHENCMEPLVPIFQQALWAKNRDMRGLSYRLLKGFDQLDQSDEDLYLTTYLLEGPSVGKIFNLAWSIVKIIGQDYERRQTLLKRLAKLDPLPDQIFDSGNILKRDTLAKFLAHNIPEYFSFYADTCVRYRQGQGKYPYGNPTLHCDKFFTLAQQHQWLSQEVKLKYAATLKP